MSSRLSYSRPRTIGILTLNWWRWRAVIRSLNNRRLLNTHIIVIVFYYFVIHWHIAVFSNFLSSSHRFSLSLSICIYISHIRVHALCLVGTSFCLDRFLTPWLFGTSFILLLLLLLHHHLHRRRRCRFKCLPVSFVPWVPSSLFPFGLFRPFVLVFS